MATPSAVEPTAQPIPLPRRRHRRHLVSPSQLRLAVYALIAVGVCELVGTVGFHVMENFTWVDSFYEESMLATGQGPAINLTHDSSKIFASIMGFISLGSTLTSIVVALAPIVARFWHEARLVAERDAREIEADLHRLRNHSAPRDEPPS
jgi:hypothetical protein